MVRAEVAVVGLVAKYVVGGIDHGSRDGEDSLARTVPALEAKELASEMAVLDADSSPGSLNECGLKPRSAGAGTVGEALSGALVQPRAETCPGDEGCASVGKRVMSTPISAVMTLATVVLTPGMVIRRWTAERKGAKACERCASSRPMDPWSRSGRGGASA